MHISKKMNIPAEYLSDVLKKSVQEDIHQQINRNVEDEDLDGFEYVKEFNDKSKATINILKFEKGKAYHYSTVTNKNTFHVKYDITSENNNQCTLDYTEEIESQGRMQQINDAVVGVIWSFLKKRRFLKMLSQIEHSYS
ncbi:DUF3284 domain-containing protein [Lacticigenium naphthae]|uniref:DUF3284 domain-containing protein n=1 Tax=Lacticigenium naphthae TaxID=515351 RepID=UPI00040B60B2|nr:DUF3284 domain-containing protein [Lacticigenium naphthae]